MRTPVPISTLPGLRRQLADQRLDQRRLAAAVRTDDADLVAAVDVRRDVARGSAAARVADGELGRADRLLAAEIAAGLEGEADLPRVLPFVVGALEPLQLLEHLAPALRLLGLLPGEVAADEVLGLVDVLLLALVRGARAFQPRVALDDVLVVARTGSGRTCPFSSSTISRHTARMNARSCDTSTNAPVYSARYALQPLDRGQVQVVGRLVQQQRDPASAPAPSPARAGRARRPTACRPSAPDPPRRSRRRSSGV